MDPISALGLLWQVVTTVDDEKRRRFEGALTVLANHPTPAQKRQALNVLSNMPHTLRRAGVSLDDFRDL